MTAPPGSPRRLSRLVRLAVPATILAIILLAVTGAGFIEYSARPGFCKSCHNMVPYYNSWATSSHRGVPCIKCHYAPGIKAEAMGKLQAANQVVKYVTGAYGQRPWAEIEDAACLRSGCHSERKVEGALDYHGVRFDHAKHLGELRRGKQLRCTSCHSQIVQGEHVAVTPSTCYLCHFKDRPPGQPIGGCTGCHPTPPRVVSPAGYVVDHAQYVADQVSCISCHNPVTVGEGAAERARCLNCHNEPERIAVAENPDRVHQVHITDHKVECTQCHGPIEHHVVALASTFELDCRSCHRETHDAQRRLYAGLGGHEVPNAPSSMFLARVSCLGCHGQAKTVRGHERVQVAGEASCLSCHGVRYANILPAWRDEMARRLSRVEQVLAQARERLDAAGPARRAAADSLLRLARDNVDLVRVGRPAHNIVYADQLLRRAAEQVRAAVKAGALPYAVPALDLGRPLGETACLRCHLGIERSRASFQGGGTFSHERHVQGGGLACTTCHTSLERHGGTRVATRAECQACHHQGAHPADCARCHAAGDQGPDSTFRLPGGVSFPHAVHRPPAFACAACHTGPGMTASSVDCDQCHETHHEPERACVSCHRESGALERHGPMAEVVHGAEPPCAACHATAQGITRWSREVCAACHVSRAAGHYEAFARGELGCLVCHKIPPAG